MDDKKKRRKMPSAPIKSPGGNVKGIGPLGQFTGGGSPTMTPSLPGNPQPLQTFMRGYSSAPKGKRTKG
jgi:hypothetical protein